MSWPTRTSAMEVTIAAADNQTGSACDRGNRHRTERPPRDDMFRGRGRLDRERAIHLGRRRIFGSRFKGTQAVVELVQASQDRVNLGFERRQLVDHVLD